MKKRTILKVTVGMSLVLCQVLYAGAEGDYNTFYGKTAGGNLSAGGGQRTVLIGRSAGYYLSPGSDNDAYNNTFVGTYAGAGEENNSTGHDNNFFGYASGNSNTAGNYNVFNGSNSGHENTTGNYNVFNGADSGYENTTGYSNVFTGRNSGHENTTGYSNVFTGYDSGYYNTTGSNNVFNGNLSGFRNTTGYYNVFSGANSGSRNTTGNYNVFNGANSGHENTTGNYNVFSGNRSGYYNTSGRENVFIGDYSGNKNTTGFYNVFTGASSGTHNTTGVGNTFIGRSSGYENTTGDNNVFNGYLSGYKNKEGNANVFIGNRAGYYETRSNRLYIENSSSTIPLIYGEFDTGVVKINGELNTSKAITASFEGTTSKQALKMMDISVNNTDTNVKSDVGFAMTNAREDFSWSFRTWEDDNGFAISKYGNGANKEFRLTGLAGSDSVELHLGNGASCDSNGQWLNASSRSYKENITTLSSKEALETLHSLTSVTYNFKRDASKETLVGFIAEDMPDLLATKDKKTVDPLQIISVLTKVVQEQEQVLAETRAEAKVKDAEMVIMKAEIAELKTIKKKVAMMEAILTNLALDTSSIKQDKVSLNQK